MALSLTFGGIELALRAGLFEQEYYQGAFLEGELINPKSKILILGDSFLANWGTGQSLAELLHAEFKAQGIQILNTANFGDGPLDYLIQLKALGPRFKPDRVLLFYYSGNDLTNVQYRSGWRAEIKKWLKPYALHFRLFYFLKYKFEELRQRGIDYKAAYKKGVDPEALRLARSGGMNPWLVDLSRSRPDMILDNAVMESAENQKAWEEVKAFLRQIKGICDRFRAPLTMVMIPPTFQVNDSHFDFYKNLGFKIDSRTVVENRPQELMKEFCESEKIECLDLLPFFRSQKDREFYLKTDDHFNAQGNQFAKKYILDFLKNREGLLPAKG